MAVRSGIVTAVSGTEIRVDDSTYKLLEAPSPSVFDDNRTLILPISRTWQEPVVEVGQEIVKKQLVARGVTHIYFQANVWIFTILVFLIGIAMGIGKAAVYKYIPDYFPNDVGVVGGMVGVLGGLGGFVCPILFGFLLESLGLWTTTWMFLLGITVLCLIWLNVVVRRITRGV
jgi:NNP family nitrate/nitrite transporter-like MFS transporter